MIGDKNSKRGESSFPTEVNELGIQVINLAWAIKIAEHFGEVLYHADENSTMLTKVTSVTDIYPEIVL
jgi:hypothetical protein